MIQVPKDLDKPNPGEKYWVYEGQCRKCGEQCSWSACEKTQMTYQKFYLSVRENFWPQFMAYCETCSQETVFDLIALSKNRS